MYKILNYLLIHILYYIIILIHTLSKLKYSSLNYELISKEHYETPDT
jgi:hypothetical protein